MLSSSSDQILESTQKPKLRKAFKLLKSHACKVANFTLQWQDLEDHLRFIHSQIESKLQQYPASNTILPNDTNPSSKDATLSQNNNHPQSDTEIKAKLIQRSVKTGKELILYVKEHAKDHKLVQDYLFKVFKALDEPGKLVLEAVKGFYSQVDIETRRSCVVVLEEFGRMVRGGGDYVAAEVREEAKRLAFDWRGKMRLEKTMEVSGFLQLLVAFEMVGEFDLDEILKLFDFVVTCKQAPELFRALGLADKASEYIQKLIAKDKRLEAIKFIYAFELVNQFPPVPLLKAHRRYAKKVSKNIREKGNNSHKAWDDAYKFGSEYSSRFLGSQIEHLKKEERNTNAKTTCFNDQSRQSNGNKHTVSAPKAQQSRRKRNKHHQTTDLNTSMNTSPTVYSKQPSHHQPASSFAGQDAQYSTPSAGTGVPSNAAPYAYAGVTSNTQIQPSSCQATHILTGAQHLTPSLGNYRGASSASFTSYTSLATRPFELSFSAPTAPTYPRTSAPPGGLYERIMSTDGSSGQFGFATSHTPMTNAPNACPNLSGQFGLATNHTHMADASNAITNLSYYVQELLRTSAYYNRQASSSSMGIAPTTNTSFNTSGYSDRPLSSGRNHGPSSMYRPSSYLP